MKRSFEYLAGMTPRRSYEIETRAPLCKYVNSARPAGVLGLGNFFGIAVFDIAGDECIAAWHNGDGYTGAHRHAIHYSTAGRPFIKKGNSRYYLDEFTRVFA